MQALPILGVSARVLLVDRLSAQVAGLPGGIIDPGGNRGFLGGRMLYRLSSPRARTGLFAAAGGMVELDTYQTATETGSQPYLSATAGAEVALLRSIRLGLEVGVLHTVRTALTASDHPSVLPVAGLGIHHQF